MDPSDKSRAKFITTDVEICSKIIQGLLKVPTLGKNTLHVAVYQ